MLDLKTDGRLQASAGATLVGRSRLVRWSAQHFEFSPVPREDFEYSWKMDVDPSFGRLMCWIHFSAGMEFWLKGVCFLNGIDFRMPIEVGSYPDESIGEWACDYSKDWRSQGTVSVTSYGTLGGLTWREGNKEPSVLDRLLKLRKASQSDQQLVRAAVHFLGKSIRNRDAHGYVPNVRDSHYDLVPELFARCLNITLDWIPDGRSALNDWIKSSEELIAAAGN